MTLETARLRLYAVDADEARRLLARASGPGDRWAPDYPFEGDLAGLNGFLKLWENAGDPRPFGYYRIERRADGLSIGGIGFKAPPDDAGEVEIGYGLAPSARGSGFAAEALSALVDLARAQDVRRVVADTDPGNTASQRTLERAGFGLVSQDSAAHAYALTLASDVA